MEKLVSILALSALVATTGCASSKEEKSLEKEPVFFNICLILDGTDRVDKQQAIPEIDFSFVMSLVDKIQRSGEGTLWLSWVDDNSENNTNAYLKIVSAPIQTQLEPKKDWEIRTEYNKKVKEANEQFKSDSIEFEKAKSERIFVFQKEVQEVIRIAYSDKVAKNRKGSDIHGAINLGVRLLKSVPYYNVSHNHLILVSDLVDNVGKELISPIPDNITIISVNQSFSKHQLEGIIEKELASLEQIYSIIN